MELIEKLAMKQCCMDEDGCTDAPIIQKLNEVIDRLNSIDTVSVVRCRECNYFGKNEENDTYCASPYGLSDPTPYDFCSYGKRKEGYSNG